MGRQGTASAAAARARPRASAGRAARARARHGAGACAGGRAASAPRRGVYGEAAAAAAEAAAAGRWRWRPSRRSGRVFTAPHWRMKQLVGLYCDRVPLCRASHSGRRARAEERRRAGSPGRAGPARRLSVQGAARRAGPLLAAVSAALSPAARAPRRAGRLGRAPGSVAAQPQAEGLATRPRRRAAAAAPGLPPGSWGSRAPSPPCPCGPLGTPGRPPAGLLRAVSQLHPLPFSALSPPPCPGRHGSLPCLLNYHSSILFLNP